MVYHSRTILAIGAHPDDIELGCGGTISAASKLGAQIVCVFLTKGEQSGDSEKRIKESKAALALLGTKEVYFGDFPDAEIPNSHVVISFIESFINKFRPHTILTHTVNDTHQDHRQTGWASLSAARNVQRVLAYESPRVSAGFSPTYFTDISEYIDDKWHALECHLSQKNKRYLAYESMIHLASFRGSMVNLPAAEAFEVIRYIESIT
jgi:LmbE family N-acetylglucosaminyl deacetylase